jgi:hypothetical protein
MYLHYKVVFLFLFLLSACSDRITLHSYYNRAQPCGYIVLKNKRNQICDVQVILSVMDSSEKLKPSIWTYIVWFENNNNVTNIGVLQSNSKKYAYRLYTHIQTICLINPIRIFITEEAHKNVISPKGIYIASTKKF